MSPFRVFWKLPTVPSDCDECLGATSNDVPRDWPDVATIAGQELETTDRDVQQQAAASICDALEGEKAPVLSTAEDEGPQQERGQSESFPLTRRSIAR